MTSTAELPDQLNTGSNPASPLIQLAIRLRAEHLPALRSIRPKRQFFTYINHQAAQLEAIYRVFSADPNRELSYSQASEWLLDNYYVVQQAVEQVHESLPLQYYEEMPVLTEAQGGAGLPRVYWLARSLVQFEQFRLETDRAKQFLLTYQEDASLTIGEIWAFPTWLRFVMLEGLIQFAAGLIDGVVPPRPEQTAVPFEVDGHIDRAELISGCILSLRLLANENWNVFFEEVSLVEHILRQDPAQVYDRMTFKTRDHYRKIVEKLAQSSPKTETDVAEAAVSLAQKEGIHTGIFLMGQKRPQLEDHLGFQLSISEQIRRWLGQHPTLLYLGSLYIITLFTLTFILWYGFTQEASAWMLGLIILLSLIPVMDFAVTVVNWAINKMNKPRLLPKMDFSSGIPPAYRTMVVIPCMLTNHDEVDFLLEQLQQQYLRNADPQLGFALLSDYADAQEESIESDEPLLEQARQGVQQLNERYAARPFYLFHRRRLWNAVEGKWMGWERKRGKLHEFNRLLRGAVDTSYFVQEGNRDWLAPVRNVITLDADTILPLDTAARLVGTLAHPLNQARFEDGSGRVTSGYTILQPRTEIQPVSASQTRFTRIFSGDSGLDLYTLAVSDIYQDLFGEGIYTGKGIYEIDSFERGLKNRVPQNSMLSHDLFEGLQGRAGLLTDVVLYEDYPPNFLTFLLRSHRWIRGDWQLLPWLFPHIPTTTGKQRNDLPLFHLWKIADNLRRSLRSPSLYLYLILGWLFFPGSLWGWTLIGLLLSASSVITTALSAIWEKLRGSSWSESFRSVGHDTLRWLLYIAFLPFETILVMDAILRTLWRLFVTKRNLLEWTPAARTSHLVGSELSTGVTIRYSVPAIALGLFSLVLLLLVNPAALTAAAPLLVIWLLSFFVAQWINQPLAKSRADLSADQQQQLRKLARATWLFFEQFVTPADHWLPPDHFQESPLGVVAHRTSPTNIGLYLISALAAQLFGYMSLGTFAIRLQDTLSTLSDLNRYRGHFLNWIDTTTLNPLGPRYVSTVDSGNLAGSLLALTQGCQKIKKAPVWSWQRWQGFLDLLGLFAGYIEETAVDGQAIQNHISQVSNLIATNLHNPAIVASLLNKLIDENLPELEKQLLKLMRQQPQGSTPILHDWRIYMERLRRHLLSMQRELKQLLPWLLIWPPPFWDTNQRALRKAARDLAENLKLSANEDAWPSLVDLPLVCRNASLLLERIMMLLGNDEEALEWCAQLRLQLDESCLNAESLLGKFDDLADAAYRFAYDMDFSFLYNLQRDVFHIGYNLESEQLDTNYYDLLASECRIASLFAIAKRDVPSRHWLHLARPLTRAKGGLALLSWSGTMFEYLMPGLLMRNFRDTLLDESCRAVVRSQIAYGAEKKVPWGISESGYYAFDSANNYQYRAFGIPELGYKRGLADDLVIAPYASILALSYQPEAALSNLDHLQEMKMQGVFGLYEAADFTPGRMPLGQNSARVVSYMSHHQGMIMVALSNYLQNNQIVQYFHDNPLIESVELLLQEQVPVRAPLEESPSAEALTESRSQENRIFATPWTVPAESDVPLVHWLSNGRFHTLITNSGGGQIVRDDIAVTRWRPDSTQDNWGTWIYVQDMETEKTWSAGIQPMGSSNDQYGVQYLPHMARFHRHDFGISLLTEIIIPPDADLEIRRITVTNHTDQPRSLRLTSYAEVVLTDATADRRHQAFAKLFVESQFVAEMNAILFRRRPRAALESPQFLANMLVVGEGVEPTRAYESDRASFLGRWGTIHNPAALTSEKWLTGAAGATLDPIMALGQVLELEPYAGVELALITATADTRANLLELCRNYERWTVINQTFSQARHQSEKELRKLNLPVDELARIQKLLSRLLYPSADLRAGPKTLATNIKGQTALWAYGISGDNPILLVKIEDEDGQLLLQTLLQAHTYWRRRGLKIDLVILNQQDTNYGQPLQTFIQRLIERQESDHWLNRRGGIFVIRQDQMNQEDRTLLLTASRVILDSVSGSLTSQLDGLAKRPNPLPHFIPSETNGEEPLPVAGLTRPQNLQFDNGYGGFSADGREYIIHLPHLKASPAPWINVIANDQFGFIVSENGGGYSWAINSGENRLTTFRNDPVSDTPAEALYLRDEVTAAVWSPTSQPCPAKEPYNVHHGIGFSKFEHISHQLQQETTLFVPPNAPVKIVQLELKNLSPQTRRLTITYYAEWVLGADRAITQPYIQPWYRSDSFALMAKNPYNVDFGKRVTFLAADRKPHGYTTDRASFLGRLGSLRAPDALYRMGLDNRVQAGVDPCGVIQVHVALEPGASDTVIILLGQAENEEKALSIIENFNQPERVAEAWQDNGNAWEKIIGTVQVETPDPGLDLLLNNWLLYQALSCRIWGRSALYQSSGAFGFRDQLQDVMTLLHARPDIAREHLLRSARHQFEEGDVLHWWHPPKARGVRTRITDDLVWLPFVMAEYIAFTGDRSLLDEQVPYLTAIPLADDEEERYGLYEHTAETYTLFDHGCRALDQAATKGRHDLPLMGGGDWNDGMNRVGAAGYGESIWLGWFLYEALQRFADLCCERDEEEKAAQYRRKAADYRQAIEEQAWDGAWYRRAYFDDGTPLGAAENEECRIDSIAQSWGVLSGGADPDRAKQSMASVRDMLIKEKERLILLFTPPFDNIKKDPGYIKGYLPGIRENGGQYTHAALWTIWAFSKLGECETAVSLFRLINPIYRADTADKAEQYKVEAYVVSADVYGVQPHEGRGGWTWYTGSSGWMYRLGLEGILGVQRRDHKLHIRPNIPASWPGYHVTYQFESTTLKISAARSSNSTGNEIQQITMDGQILSGQEIPLIDDGQSHSVCIVLGKPN